MQWKPEKNEQNIELDEEQEKDPYETLLIWHIEEEFKLGDMQMEKWSILSDVIKYVQVRREGMV